MTGLWARTAGLLIVEIAIGVATGICLAFWLLALPHKRRVRKYTQSLLASDPHQILDVALRGYDEIFSKHNRDWLIELSFCDDKAKRADLARKIAEDTAERWHKMASGEGSELKSMMTENDRDEIRAAGDAVRSLAEEVDTLAKYTGLDNAIRKDLTSEGRT